MGTSDEGKLITVDMSQRLNNIAAGESVVVDQEILRGQYIISACPHTPARLLRPGGSGNACVTVLESI
ncbi:MAG: hypothetical protein O3C28_11650 [Proteobacteria bacterium]|nr:hypothetical protein [Pseudomonadota bacterium]